MISTAGTRASIQGAPSPAAGRIAALNRAHPIAGFVLSAIGTLGCGPSPVEITPWPAPSAQPDRLVITFESEPCRSHSVTWRTESAVRRARAQLSLARGEPDLTASAREVAVRSEELNLSESDWNADLDYDKVRYHSTQFRDLEPRTRYAYRVGSSVGSRVGPREVRWSEWHQFKTPPCGRTTDASGRSSDDADPDAGFRFLYFGDLQNGVLSHGSRAVRAAYAHAPDAAFALYAGDLVNDGHWDLDWARWHAAGGWLHATLPVVPVVGNHEVRALDRQRQGKPQLSMLWRRQFALPVDHALPAALAETVYSFDIGAARFFVLNTSFGQDEQAEWLVGQLEAARADGVRWQIVSFHLPTFSNAPDRDNPALRAFVRPLFSQYGVDVVLQGHDHSYSRGSDGATSSGAPGTAAGMSAEGNGRPTGPIYVVSVAGAKQYALGQPMWGEYTARDDGPSLERFAANTQMFQVIEITDDRLSYRAYTAAGTLYDGFELIDTSNVAAESVIDYEVSGVSEASPRRALKRLVELRGLQAAQRTFENTGPYRNDHWRRN